MAEDRNPDSEQAAVPDQYATAPASPEDGALWLAAAHAAGWPIRRGRYELLKLLGEGAMGAVYLARDVQLERQVAIKVPKFADSSATAIRRFQREARAMATLHHANLCPLYDVGEIDGVHYLTMAYLQGQTLAAHLAPGKPLPGREVALLILKLAQAAGEAHRCGVVHRDLKPANIMIDQRREPIVMDFGLACLTDGKSSLTQLGMMIGTPVYMSPEQVRGDLHLIGSASDVYSLGAIMYQMLTGAPPFAGSIASVVRQALAETPDCPSSLEDGVDPQLGAICLQALEKEPSKRFASGAALALALRDYLIGPKPKPNATSVTAKVATAPLTPDHVRLADEVRRCWQRGDYADALPRLERLAKSTDPQATAYASWVQRELPKVREKLWSLAAYEDFLPAPDLPRLPLHTQRNRDEHDVPRWLIWVMATPACVLLFLAVIVVATQQDAAPVASRSEPTANRVDEIASSKLQPAESAADASPVAREETTLADPTDLPPPPLGPPSHEQLLRNLDENENGLLEVDEIPPSRRDHLGQADTNEDGVLTREEVDEFHARVPPSGPPRQKPANPLD
ncbi:MAG: protein kinase [Planctomycetia bacterium]|nr:protein kinase [Planctomycetia bacterium]